MTLPPRAAGKGGPACALVRMAVLLALCSLAGPVRADDPLTLIRMQPVPKTGNDGTDRPPETAPQNKTDPAALPPAPPAPPPVPPDVLWNNVVDRHHAYVHELDRLSGADYVPPTGFWGLHPFAEGGFNMVHSYFSNHPSFLVTLRAGTAAAAPSLTQSTNAVYAVNFGPRVTLGAVTDCGLGFRASWWFLDESNATRPMPGGDASLLRTVSSAPVPGVPGFTSPGPVARQLRIFGDQVVFSNHVGLDVWDAEAFRDFRCDCWDLLLSGGLRYGYLSQRYDAFRTNSGNTRVGTTRVTILQDTDSVNSGHNFAGVGPTLAVEGRRRLGASHWAVYASARGSLLLGHGRLRSSQLTVTALQTAVGTAAPRTVLAVAARQASFGEDDRVPMGDFEAGVDWADTFGRVLLFVRAGLVNETWFGTGNATTFDGDTGFVGLRLTAGIRY